MSPGKSLSYSKYGIRILLPAAVCGTLVVFAPEEKEGEPVSDGVVTYRDQILRVEEQIAKDRAKPDGQSTDGYSGGRRSFGNEYDKWVKKRIDELGVEGVIPIKVKKQADMLPHLSYGGKPVFCDINKFCRACDSISSILVKEHDDSYQFLVPAQVVSGFLLASIPEELYHFRAKVNNTVVLEIQMNRGSSWCDDVREIDFVSGIHGHVSGIRPLSGDVYVHGCGDKAEIDDHGDFFISALLPGGEDHCDLFVVHKSTSKSDYGRAVTVWPSEDNDVHVRLEYPLSDPSD